MTPLTSRGLRAPTLAHGFFTRAGGVSTGIYESLNCGSGSRDDG
jgi:copper oxidase (laccase) domain-containing protein